MPRRRRASTEPAAALAAPALDPASRSDGALTAATLAIIVLAFVRCLVPVTTNLYWEDDPRRVLQVPGVDPAEAAAAVNDITPQFFGSAGVAALDALSLAAAGSALLVHTWAGGALRWFSLVAGGIGMLFCFIHARANVENAFHCGSWIGGIALGLAALHLASRARQRRWFVAALIAIAVPLAIDATRYVFVDHADSVAFFKENESEWLRARGWERGSPEHLMYLRRMEFGEPTGAFTFSNILASVSASIAVLSSALAVGLFFKRKTLPWRWALPAVGALVAIWTVYLTHSKGAPVAAVMAAGAVGLACLARQKAWLPRVLPAIALALVLCALTIVVLRGMKGPPSDEHGERSLLFRFHYWEAAARIVGDSPANALLGVGPAQFSDDYNWAKNPINPEEVRSAHSVFVDFIAMLGLGGAALTALLIVWLWWAARSTAEELAQSEPAEARVAGKALEVSGPDLRWIIVFLAVLFGVEMLVRGATYGTPGRFLSWSAGLTGAFFLIAVLASRHWQPAGFDRLALLGGATVMLVHAQIEMTFFQASSAAFAWLIVGAAAAGREPTEAGIRHESSAGVSRSVVTRLLPGGLLMIGALVVTFMLAAPIADQQSLLRDAARSLRQGGRGFLEAVELLSRAMRVRPADAKAFEWHARLCMEAATNIRQSIREIPASQLSPRAGEDIRRWAQQSLATFDEARAAGLDSAALHRQHAMMLAHAAEVLADPSYLEKALQAWREMVARRPYAWQDRVELAELLWKLDRREDARSEYTKALELSENLYLEPTRMMAPVERRRIEGRLKEEKRD